MILSIRAAKAGAEFFIIHQKNLAEKELRIGCSDQYYKSSTSVINDSVEAYFTGIFL